MSGLRKIEHGKLIDMVGGSQQLPFRDYGRDMPVRDAGGE